MGGAKSDEGGHVEGTHPDDADMGQIGGELQQPAVLILELFLGNDAHPLQQGPQLLENPSLGQGQHQGFAFGCTHCRPLPSATATAGIDTTILRRVIGIMERATAVSRGRAPLPPA